MRKTTMWLFLTIACCGLSQAYGGSPVRGFRVVSSGVFIPPIEDNSPGNVVNPWEKKDNDRFKAGWSPTVGSQVGESPSQSSARKTTPVKKHGLSRKHATASASFADIAGCMFLVQPWILALLGAGGAAAVIVGVFFAARSIRAKRSRSARLAIMATGLIQPQLRGGKARRDRCYRNTTTNAPRRRDEECLLFLFFYFLTPK